MPSAGGEGFTRDFSLSLNMACPKRFNVRKNLEASVLYLSCGWRSSDDKAVNMSVL